MALMTEPCFRRILGETILTDFERLAQTVRDSSGKDSVSFGGLTKCIAQDKERTRTAIEFALAAKLVSLDVSTARISVLYRGDNKNLAFVSSLFDAQRGFAAHNHISYGDEDIFISRAANKNNTAIEFAPEATTVLQRGTNHRYWRDHKEGLYFTRKYNTLKNRLLLNGFGVVNFLFYVTLALAVIFTYSDIVLLSVTLGIIALRLISQYFVFGFAAKKLQEKQVIPALLLYDLIFAFLNPIYYLAAQLHHERFSSSTR